MLKFFKKLLEGPPPNETFTCWRCGTSWDIYCSCVADPFGGGMCNAHMDAPYDCPTCYPQT